MQKTILLCCEFGPELGMGHLMRVLSYARQLKRAGWESDLYGFFVSEDLPPARDRSSSAVLSALTGLPEPFWQDVIGRLQLETLSIQELQRKESVPPPEVPGTGYQAVLVDSYHLPLRFYRNISKLAPVCLAIDDFERIEYPPQYWVVQALLDPETKVRSPGGARYLRGLRYQILPPEFQAPPPPPPKSSETDRWKLVFVPGSAFRSEDLSAFAAEIQKALPSAGLSREIPQGIHWILSRFHSAQTLKLPADWTISQGLEPGQLIGQYQSADAVLSACGQSLLEIVSAGYPAAGLLSADNQIPVARQLQRRIPIPILDLRPWLLQRRDPENSGPAEPPARWLADTLSRLPGTEPFRHPELDGGAINRILTAAGIR